MALDQEAPGQVVLEAVGVSKTFPGVRALREVSFAVRAGEVHALVGENGAGKSTLIKVLTGVYQLDSGQLRHRGREVTFASPGAAQAAGISTIYQELDLVPLQSATRNLYLGREPRTRLGLIDFARMKREARALLQEYQIDVDVDAPLASLGLGAQQMVSVARAIASKADVVIMDEPTSSLEAREVETLMRLIGRLTDDGVAIVYVSHRLDELYRICDRVTVLRDGQLVHTGPLSELNRAQLVATMLGRELAAQTKRHETPAEERVGQPEGPAVLEAVGLSRRGLLHDVSVSIRAGEVVGLGGLLGAGRSETGKAILGAQRLDSGTVTVEGEPISTGSPAAAISAGIALLPEDRKLEGILPNLSVRDNILLAALPRLSRAGLMTARRGDEIVERFMKSLNIRATGPEQKVGTLSGGNQQKVLLARWLCLNPKVLILDEPTRGIDVGAKTEVRATIDRLAEDGLAVLLISSETEELVDDAHRIVVLREGRVIDTLTGDRMSESELVTAIAGTAPDDVGPNASVPGPATTANTDHDAVEEHR
jgi:monosaccharide-transporting ATPase